MKIKYFIMRSKNVVYFSIIGMDERLRQAEGVFISGNGLLIKSQFSPEITHDTIYLRGAKKNKDCFFINKEFDSEEEAKAYIDRLNEALEEWSEKWPGWTELQNIDDFEVDVQ